MSEPVNERPLFPTLHRPDGIGVSMWSVSLIRQLVTVFQQYGYRLNQALLEGDLDTEGGEIVTDQGDSVLRESNLAENDGTIPETDRVNDFDFMMLVGGDEIIERGSNANGEWVRYADGTQICRAAWSIDYTFSTTLFMEAQWTYPAPFVVGELPEVWGILNTTGGDWDQSRAIIGHFGVFLGGSDNTQVELRITSAGGDWTSGNDIRNQSAIAVGRWK
jgi:hypothetical protein